MGRKEREREIGSSVHQVLSVTLVRQDCVSKHYSKLMEGEAGMIEPAPGACFD